MNLKEKLTEDIDALINEFKEVWVMKKKLMERRMKTKIGKYVDGIISKAENFGLHVSILFIQDRTLTISAVMKAKNNNYAKFLEEVEKKNKWELIGSSNAVLNQFGDFEVTASFYRREA